MTQPTNIGGTAVRQQARNSCPELRIFFLLASHGILFMCMLAPLQNTSTRTWPGLGGSDTDYAWALTFPPLCEFAVFPLALWMTRRVPFTVPLLIGVSLLVVSGTMYALSGDVWVLMISRGVMGMGGGLSIPALHTYMGEMGTVMDQVREKQGKKPRKFAVYIAFSFIMSGGFVIAFGE
jgi:MFS family permease